MVVLVARGSRMPEDAPLARMYRAETDITALAKAVEAYFEVQGLYPSAGTDGLRLATEFLSSKALYFPQGPPLDPWGRPYQYVSHDHYEEPGSVALRSPAGYWAPDHYQLYSKGADGDAGIDDPSKQRDNVCNWDREKSWRAVYKALQETFDEGNGLAP